MLFNDMFEDLKKTFQWRHIKANGSRLWHCEGEIIRVAEPQS